MNRAALRVLLLVVGLAACLPRENPFDRANIEDAYGVFVTASLGTLTVHFNRLGGTGLRGYHVYREDVGGARVLVGELPPDQQSFVDENVEEAAARAEELHSDGTLWWRVAGFTAGGEGPVSARTDRASTRILPETSIEPAIAPYISGQSGVTVQVRVAPSPLPGAPATRQFRYRFRGGDWIDPILAGPLVLTGLQDGRYTLELAAVDDQGDADITPARATFVYDYNVPQGTACTPAVCNPGLLCVGEPVGNFCRQQCAVWDGDGGAAPEDAGVPLDCPLGTTCRLGSGRDGNGACVAVATLGERCDERLCVDGLNCAVAGDGRSLCGTPCNAGACDNGLSCYPGDGCLTVARLNEGCASSACLEGLACDDREMNARCRRVCTSTVNCTGGEQCGDLGRADLRVCR